MSETYKDRIDGLMLGLFSTYEEFAKEKLLPGLFQISMIEVDNTGAIVHLSTKESTTQQEIVDALESSIEKDNHHHIRITDYVAIDNGGGLKGNKYVAAIRIDRAGVLSPGALDDLRKQMLGANAPLDNDEIGF